MPVRMQKVQTIADRVKMNPREAAKHANESFMSYQESTPVVQGKEVNQKSMRVCVNTDGSRSVYESKKQVVESVTHRYMLRSRC
jgi:hypothetical protein